MRLDWLDEGYYRLRLRARGPWVPARVRIDPGDSIVVPGVLLSDQQVVAEWYPSTHSTRAYSVPPDRLVNRAEPISRGEFEWLILLRTLAPRKP
jgi:hypothetical protein